MDHYGSFLAERDSQIGILMEYCEGGSLDGLMAKMRGREGMRCSEHVLGRIASSVSDYDQMCIIADEDRSCEDWTICMADASFTGTSSRPTFS